MPSSVPYTVWTRASLSAGDWIEDPHLVCDQLTRGLAPTMDNASLSYKFGMIARDGDLTASYYPRLEIQKHYVRIIVPSLSIDWVGYILTEELDRGPYDSENDRLASGRQVFGVVGLEWFLARKTVNRSIIHPDTEVQRAIGYNAGFGDGRDLAYVDRANKDTRGASFADDKDHAELWDAKEIVEDLLADHQPQDKSGNDEPATYALHGAAHNFLNWFKPTVECEEKSLWQVLNDVISRRRGLVWWLEYNHVSGNVDLRVSSIATDNIGLPDGQTLFAAANIVTLPDVDDWAERVNVKRDAGRRFGVAVCRGARRRAVFTVSPTSENLEPSWKSTEETAYKGGSPTDNTDPDLNDRFRQANRFERVYQMYQIPADWNGLCNDGGSVPADDTKAACPKFVQGSASIVGATEIAMPGLRLLRTMPMRVGYDYDDATAPTARDPDNIYAEWQRPFAVVDVDGAGTWRFTHEINTNEESGEQHLASYHLRVLDGTAGVQLSPSSGMPHSIAKNHFNPDTDAVSQYAPEVDFSAMRVTVAAEWDAYCEAQWPTGDLIPDDDPLETLYVSLGERARFDWLAEGTIYDVQDGALETVSSGGALRDDRELCEQVAKIAHQWYGEERAELEMSFATTALPADIGDLITTIGTGAGQETVNAVVSQVTHNLERGGTSLSAGFSELDFAALV